MAFIYRLPTRTPADPAATVRATTPNGAHFLPAGDDFPERHMAGSADPLGDDQAERTSAWGALEECAPEGGKFYEPGATCRGDEAGVLAWLAWPLAVIFTLACLAIYLR